MSSVQKHEAVSKWKQTQPNTSGGTPLPSGDDYGGVRWVGMKRALRRTLSWCYV